MAPHSSAVTKLPSRAAAMGAHRWSHSIAKGPPRKIRIVHVVEPTVIKTDARQFRELVQRLTGKPPNGVSGGAGGGDSSSSSSSAESASAGSSSRAASGSSSDSAVVAPASAVKAEVEEDIASLEEQGFARAFGEVLGDTKDGATTATVKAAVKEDEEEEASPEEEGFARALGVVDDTYDSSFHGLDDFLLSTFTDGFSL